MFGIRNTAKQGTLSVFIAVGLKDHLIVTYVMWNVKQSIQTSSKSYSSVFTVCRHVLLWICVKYVYEFICQYNFKPSLLGETFFRNALA